MTRPIDDMNAAVTDDDREDATVRMKAENAMRLAHGHDATVKVGVRAAWVMPSRLRAEARGEVKALEAVASMLISSRWADVEHEKLLADARKRAGK